MGGSGSRLSKELLAEYQVRGAPVLAELACGPAQGNGVREQVAGRPWLSGGLQTLVWICLSGPDVPDQAGDPPVSAALTQVLQLGIAGGGLCGCFFSGVRTGRLTFEGGAVLLGCQDRWIWNWRPRVQVPPAPEPHLCTTQTLLCIQEKLSCLSCASLISLLTAELPVLFSKELLWLYAGTLPRGKTNLS